MQFPLVENRARDACRYPLLCCRFDQVVQLTADTQVRPVSMVAFHVLKRKVSLPRCCTYGVEASRPDITYGNTPVQRCWVTVRECLARLGGWRLRRGILRSPVGYDR